MTTPGTPGPEDPFSDCTICKGTGAHDCQVCQGTGQVTRTNLELARTVDGDEEWTPAELERLQHLIDADANIDWDRYAGH